MLLRSLVIYAMCGARCAVCSGNEWRRYEEGGCAERRARQETRLRQWLGNC